MKFCFFSAQYLPTVGGVERYTFNIARLLVERGHSVTVITSLKNGLPENETDEHGVNVIRLPSFLLMNGRFPVVKITKFWKEVKQLFSQGIDFCVIQTRFYPLSVVAAVACKIYSCPAAVIDHSTGHMPMGKGIIGKIAAFYEHAACSVIKACGHDFYGVSVEVSRWLEHFGVKSAGQLYNAIDISAINKELNDSVRDFRKELNLDDNSRIISFAGRLIEEKGVEILIEAYKKCNLNNIALLIAGDGPLYDKLKSQNTEGVCLLGSLSHSNTLQLMAQSDIYCLPTLYAEGFPTTFLEATARGCPVITTATGGTTEFILNRDYGIVIENLTRANLAIELEKALSDKLWRKTAAENAFENLQRNFTWTKTSDRLEKIAIEKNKFRGN